MKTILNITNYLTDSFIGKLLLTLIPSYFFWTGYYKDFNFNNIKIDNMGYSLTIIFALIIFTALQINSSLKKIRIKMKYFNIMLTKFHDQQPSSIYNVFSEDLSLFSKDEQKYLKAYLKELENLRVVMKGKNKCEGMFTKND